MMKESEIQKEILGYLQSRGYFAWKNHVGPIKMGHGFNVKNPRKGSPDIEALKGGRFYGIEVKEPKRGVVSADQKAWLRRIKEHGGIPIITTGLEDLITQLEDLKNKGDY